jgi:hypothetical protein
LPEECVLISIRRQGRILIPHGDTLFLAGDQITAFVRTKNRQLLEESLQGVPPQSVTPAEQQKSLFHFPEYPVTGGGNES